MVKRPGRGVKHRLLPNAAVQERADCTSTPLLGLHSLILDEFYVDCGTLQCLHLDTDFQTGSCGGRMLEYKRVFVVRFV